MNLLPEASRRYSDDRYVEGEWLWCRCGAKAPVGTLLEYLIVDGECKDCWERRVAQEDGPLDHLLEGGAK